MAGVYWIGQDGNYYVKAEGIQGVQNMGKSLVPLSPEYIASLQQIDDPVARPTQTPANTTTTTAAAPPKVVNRDAVNSTQAGIDSLTTEEQARLGSIDRGYNELVAEYDREGTKTQKKYDEQNVSNNQNYQKNQQNAMLAAAQGRRGLRGTLAAMGALSGDGSVLADRAVTTAANQDLGGARETSASNAKMLDDALNEFKEEDTIRREKAKTSAENNRIAARSQVAQKRQQMYQKMAELFAEGGDNRSAGEWLAKTNPLNETIAQGYNVQATDLTPMKAAFTPKSLESYLAGAGDMTVRTAEGGMGGMNPTTLLAGGRRPRRREEEELAVA